MAHSKRSLQKPLGALLLLVAAIMLLNRGRMFIDATYLSLAPVVALSLVLLFSGARGALNGAARRFERGAAALSLLLAVLWLAMLSIVEIKDSRILSATQLAQTYYADAPVLARFYHAFNRFVYLPAAGLSAWGLVYRILTAARGGAARPMPPLEEAARARIVRRCMTLIGLATAFGVLCVYPMYPVSDTLFMKDLIDRGEWNAWHTIGYELFVFLTSLGGRNYFGAVVAQGLCWAGTNAYTLSVLAARPNGARACSIYTAVSLMSFLPYLYCGVMYKDGLFMSCMLGLLVSVTEALADRGARGAPYVRVGLFGLGCALFRHGAFLAVALTLAGLALRALALRRRAALIRTGVTCAALLGAFLVLNQLLPNRILSAVKTPGYVMYSVPMNMIGAIAASGEEIEPDELACMEQILPYDRWAELYDPYFTDPLSRTDTGIGKDVEKIDALGLGPKLLWLNFRFFTRYPARYLEAFFNINSIVWEIGCPDDGRAREWTWLLEFMKSPREAAQNAPATQTFGFTGVMQGLAELTRANVVYRSAVWRGGFALFALFVCAAALGVQRRAGLLVAFVPIVGYTAMLMLTIPSQDPRYILPALVSAAFLGVLAFASPDADCRRGAD